MGYQGYQGYGPKADIAQLLIQQQAAQANGMKGAPGAGAPFPPSQYPQSAGGPDLGAIPDIGSAEQQAGSSRKIADLLMDRAMSRNQQGDVVNWGTGLGQLGEALLARNANKKADSADAKYADVKAALMKQAMGGNMEALAQVSGVGAALGQQNRIEDNQRDDTRYGEERDYSRGRDRISDTRYGAERDYSRSRDQVEDTRYTGEREYTEARDVVSDSQWQQEYNLSAAELAAKRDAAKAEAAAKAAEDKQGGVLAGLPSGVQSAIVSNELKNIDQAGSASDSAEKAANLSKRFVDESKDWNAQGGGFWNDIKQALSNETAGLKGITAEMIPMMRSAGEGIMTDADAKRYESAVVSINKPRGSNEDVAAVMDAAKSNAKAYEDFLRGVMASGNYGSQQQAQQVWDAYSAENPVFDAETGQPVPERIPIDAWVGRQQAAPAAGQGQVEFEAPDQIPEGATVEDENGVRWRKQNGQLVRAN